MPIAPPLGVDMVGYLRRWRPAAAYGAPLEATALVLDDGDARLCLLGFDGLGTPGEYGRRVRAAVAEAAGCEARAVLVNASHTHAAPPPPGMLKIGGTTHDLRPEEERYADLLVDLLASAARAAAARLEPALLGAARTSVELGVNRRQRTDSGEAILGWNPEGVCDRDVAVLRVDALDGRALCTAVAYACHTVVVGPEVPELSADFAGPLRDRVRAWAGGECLYLQGCAGNILPLEAFWDRRGPEDAFAARLALAALAARDLAEVRPRVPRQQPFASAVPIGVWRLEPDGEPPAARLAAAEERVALPFLDPPSAGELAALREELEARLAQLRADGAPRETWNPVWIHAEWARRCEERLREGPWTERETSLQALRIGDVGILAWPCEPFCELGIEAKERAAAPFPLALGYTNDQVGYVATAEEYAFKGYEPHVSQRHFGNPAPFAPEAGRLLVERGVALLDSLFATQEVTT